MNYYFVSDLFSESFDKGREPLKVFRSEKKIVFNAFTKVLLTKLLQNIGE